jgi:hypothetical protein
MAKRKIQSRSARLPTARAGSFRNRKERDTDCEEKARRLIHALLFKEFKRDPIEQERNFYHRWHASLTAAIEHYMPSSVERDYLVRLLQQPPPPSPELLYRGGQYERDFTIAEAVSVGIAAGGLYVTRNKARRLNDGGHSVCSLVAEELEGFGVYLSEDAVEKIWDESPIRKRLYRQKGVSYFPDPKKLLSEK